MKTTEAGQRLRAILDRIVANPELQPSDVDGDGDKDTKCNFGVQIAAEELGYVDKFNGKLANKILAFMESEAKKHKVWLAWRDKQEGAEPARAEWCEVSAKEANVAANMGMWAVAAVYGKPSGHVASVYPSGMVWAPKWQQECPVVANIGRRNGVMGANWAFGDQPRYFVLRLPHNGLEMA